MTNSTPLRSRSCRTPLAEIERRPRVALCVGPRWRPSPMFTPLRPRLPRHSPGCGGHARRSASLFRDSPAGRVRSLGLAPCPTRSGAPRAPHALPPRRAADRFALLRGFGLGRSAIVAQRRGRRSASPYRAARCAALRARPTLRPCVSASAPGARSSSLRSSSGGRSRASPCSLPSRALRGPGFLPGPLPTSAAPPPQMFSD